MTADEPPASRDPDAESARVLQAARRALTEPRPHGVEDLVEASGLDENTIIRLFAAAQRMSMDGRYGDRDLAYARDLGLLVDRSTVDVVERELRLRLRSITQVAVNDLSTVRLDSALGTLLDDGTDPQTLGARLADLARDVVPAVERQLGADYRAALLRLLDSDVVGRVAADTARLPTMAVGFVDLVGFTRLSASTDPEGVGSVLTAFEELASHTVEAVGEVLLAKTIGDAVLYVGGSPDRVAWALLRTVEAEPDALVDVQRRAGMAYGQVLVREGDYVGTTVNTAARLTDLARPGSLVVTAEAADALTEDWELSRLPPKRLKGLPTDRHVRVRWPEPGS